MGFLFDTLAFALQLIFSALLNIVHDLLLLSYVSSLFATNFLLLREMSFATPTLLLLHHGGLMTKNLFPLSDGLKENCFGVVERLVNPCRMDRRRWMKCRRSSSVTECAFCRWRWRRRKLLAWRDRSGRHRASLFG
jgi:hypothetical protein